MLGGDCPQQTTTGGSQSWLRPLPASSGSPLSCPLYSRVQYSTVEGTRTLLGDLNGNSL